MQVGTKEWEEIIQNFEKHYKHLRLDKEPEEYQKKGQLYQNGEVNNLYTAFALGYSFGRVTYMHQSD